MQSISTLCPAQSNIYNRISANVRDERLCSVVSLRRRFHCLNRAYITHVRLHNRCPSPNNRGRHTYTAPLQMRTPWQSIATDLRFRLDRHSHTQTDNSDETTSVMLSVFPALIDLPWHISCRERDGYTGLNSMYVSSGAVPYYTHRQTKAESNRVTTLPSPRRYLAARRATLQAPNLPIA